jgi:hypothetical protein
MSHEHANLRLSKTQQAQRCRWIVRMRDCTGLTIRAKLPDTFANSEGGTAMNAFDRFILGSIAFGIWAWVLITFLSGEHIDC